ncbi:nucleotide exchange factor GrpE [Alkalicoccus urumqiensis]|uniref:Nucleotide exchange factor GrpE n=1 Tax=Alkalicoccus urumqiensis TaxID=1548213 RepID=A0A2P6MHV1_ALKUR|nr:nucleotide exchange factor GrpE [Alkalicoccus urumqiensis]PRO65872.1 nucleotide exchange factor GrpE [Alkalicoccus urumqiensis]
MNRTKVLDQELESLIMLEMEQDPQQEAGPSVLEEMDGLRQEVKRGNTFFVKQLNSMERLLKQLGEEPSGPKTDSSAEQQLIYQALSYFYLMIQQMDGAVEKAWVTEMKQLLHHYETELSANGFEVIHPIGQMLDGRTMRSAGRQITPDEDTGRVIIVTRPGLQDRRTGRLIAKAEVITAE